MSIISTLKTWAKRLKRDIVALYLARRDPRVPWYAKALAIATALYALSPIDLIPDFIPLLGYLDDVIILPLMILLTIRLIPAEVMADLRLEAEARLEKRLPASRIGAAIILAIWAFAAGLVTVWAYRVFI